MRLRNIKGADNAVQNSEYCIQNPVEIKGKWHEIFENENPIHIEIGMGKGQFLMQLATQNPNINYLGIERYTSVLFRALQKMEQEPLNNLKFLCVNAEILPEIFEKDEVDRIYLNFSDPWPKDRHSKRRLTSREFLKRYNTFLKPNGVIEFKTDNVGLFNFSLEEVPYAGFKLLASTYDLHHDPVLNEGNIMTEYEEKFSSLGNPICKMIISH